MLFGFCLSKNNSGSDEDLSKIILDVLENYHYQPTAVDDKFSGELFDLYIKRLDNNKRFFTSDDIAQLQQYRKDLDDQAKEGRYEFFTKANALYSTRLKMLEAHYKTVLETPFDFTTNEYYDFNEDSSQFLKSEEELKESWRKSLKLQVLEKLYRKIDVQDKSKDRKDTLLTLKSQDTLEAHARKEVLKTHNDWFKRLSKVDKEELKSLYINCITELFDPHTNYFPPKEKEDFDIRMSGTLEGIGATLSEKDGYIKVERIVPGSPSYKQGELKSGDLLIKVSQETGDPVDLVNMKVDDAVQYIRGKKGTTVRLTVKKPDESIKVISIVRDVVVIEEGYAKSGIIRKDGKKYGYINLPQFYTNLNQSGGRTCSKDVAIEVEKLKKDTVAGIILDLRNNGGGSLGDVVTMSGLFIEQGPIVQVKSRNKTPDILNDEDPSVQYDGPLTIMVDGYSASASEILAAALQDYHRAAIIGTGTYGKGTVQRFIDLDQGEMFFQKKNAKKLGALKITIQKFYRVNGGTTQLQGVTPDIILPDRYQFIELGEKDSEHPLGWDEIPKASYGTKLNYSKKIKKAKENSAKRMEKNEAFKKIMELAVRAKELNKKTHFTLNLKEFAAEQKKLEAENVKFDTFLKTLSENKVSNLTADIQAAAGDATVLKMKQDWLGNLKKDIYLDEAVEILKDLR
ncbi:MAG: carboxy terminal-processing peptidase [Bacteroidia bacterium]|nr:carboxy terminal-processing peptidase [Bacteroidia bacterium]